MSKRIVRFVVIGIVAVAALGLVSFVIMSLWNWILPPVTGWHAITYWQALGLLILSKILFGRFGGRPGWHWRRRMFERWEQMTPEEREKFREGMRARCGHRGVTQTS